jgi:hypothetical protein
MADTSNEDAQHLQLLAIFHYIVGGIMGLFGCIPVVHLSIGIAMVTGHFDGHGNGPPPEFGWLFIVFGSFMIAIAWSVAIAILVAGRKLATRSGHLYCLVVAAVECAFFPIGTVLGVFTIIVLMRPSVKRLFGVPVGDA